MTPGCVVAPDPMLEEAPRQPLVAESDRESDPPGWEEWEEPTVVEAPISMARLMYGDEVAPVAADQEAA